MGELKFQKLTPTQEADLSGYEDAFHYIFAEDDIRNIAISGAYSSGNRSKHWCNNAGKLFRTGCMLFVQHPYYPLLKAFYPNLEMIRGMSG